MRKKQNILPEVATTRTTPTLSLHHELIHAALNKLNIGCGAVERRPPRPRVKLGIAGKELRLRADSRASSTYILPRPLLLIKCRRERALSARLSQNALRSKRQTTSVFAHGHAPKAGETTTYVSLRRQAL